MNLLLNYKSPEDVDTNFAEMLTEMLIKMLMKVSIKMD